MAKEITLYQYLSDWSVEEIINKLEENMNQDVTMRVNSFGGAVFPSYGLFAKVKEHGSVYMKVDGIAASGAANLLLYAKEAEALSVSKIMLHRADAYTETDEQKALLNSINADLRKQLEMKVDADKFKQVTGYTIDQMFDPQTRVNIWLTAKQAKQIGLITKVINLTPEQEKEVAKAQAELESQFAMRIAASLNPTTTENLPKTSDMTIEKLKAEHPAIYASIVEEAKKEGIKAEQERVKAWMAWAKIDAEKVNKAIAEGTAFSMSDMSELSAKAASMKHIANAEADSPAPGATATAGTEAPKPTAEKELQIKSFLDSVDKHLGRAKA